MGRTPPRTADTAAPSLIGINGAYDPTYLQSAYNLTVSTGDSGYGVNFPAASRYVTAVGGTSLNQLTNTGTRNGSETAWAGGGSGCSAYVAKPAWQHEQGCGRRSVADVAAVADPNTGVWVYDSTPNAGHSGWLSLVVRRGRIRRSNRAW